MNGNSKNVSINQFLDNLPHIFDPNISRNFRARNYQSFELGMDHLSDDKTYWQNSFKVLDKQFDLVILVEYYLESLVLLSEILCVPYEGYGYAALNLWVPASRIMLRSH